VGIPRTGARGALNIITATLAACAMTAPATHARATTGALTVVVRSSASARPPLRVSIDANICGQTVPDESLVTARGLVANAVVSLPGLTAAHAAAIDVSNDKCRFIPHVAIAAPGATIRMVSRDATLHTIHAQHGGKSLFNVGLPVPGLTVSRPAAGRGPVSLKCNTHPWMSGYVYPTDDRAALSDADGTATFDQLPAGTHSVSIWHEVLGTGTAKATIVAGQRSTVEVTLGGR
jgi:plastocyanin